MQVCLNMTELKGLSQNIALTFTTKVAMKESETVLTSWTEALFNWPKSMKFLLACKMKFWIIFFMEKCLYAYKVCTETFLHIGSYNKSLYNILRQSLSQVAGLLVDNCNFLFYLTCLLLSHWQVLSKAK